MTVGELKKMLEQYPDDMEVVTSIGDGDYFFVESISRVKGIDRHGDWVKAFCPELHEDNREDIKQYLYIY